jgi:hypothetical protein
VTELAGEPVGFRQGTAGEPALIGWGRGGRGSGPETFGREVLPDGDADFLHGRRRILLDQRFQLLAHESMKTNRGGRHKVPVAFWFLWSGHNGHLNCPRMSKKWVNNTDYNSPMADYQLC